jgi:hypothetical protein
MPGFDTQTRQDPNEPNRPRSLSRAGRVLNPLMSVLRWAPTASYALAHFIVAGFWAYVVSTAVSDFGFDLNPYPDLSLLGRFLAPAMIIGLVAIPIMPFGAILGDLDAAARRSSHPLLQMLLLLLDALLIVFFPLVWIVYIVILLRRGIITPSWPMFIGILLGAELGLVMLLVVSVRLDQPNRTRSLSIASRVRNLLIAMRPRTLLIGGGILLFVVVAVPVGLLNYFSSERSTATVTCDEFILGKMGDCVMPDSEPYLVCKSVSRDTVEDYTPCKRSYADLPPPSYVLHQMVVHEYTERMPHSPADTSLA